MHDLILPQSNAILLPQEGSKDRLSRLRQYVRWLDTTGRQWLIPDLTAYRDFLLAFLSPSSVAAHLSTVRARYRELTRDRDLLYEIAVPSSAGHDPLLRKAYVDEVITRIQNAIAPEAAPVEVVTKQDRGDEEGLRLTSQEARALLAAPGLETLQGLRDTALLALLLATGLREFELADLAVEDLRQTYGGQPAVRVRRGKGRKQRYVVLGAMAGVLAFVDAWLQAAGIGPGEAVFWSYYKGWQKRRAPLSAGGVQAVLSRYPIYIRGEVQAVRPHDLRRTYARLAFDSGMKAEAIRLNLGHADIKTTLLYIGQLDGAQRATPQLFDLDYAGLAKWQGRRANGL